MKNLKKYKNLPSINLVEKNGFTNLKIVGYIPEKGNRKRPVIQATCKCGTKTLIRLNNYKSGNVKSCGCRHGRKNLPISYVYPNYTKDNNYNNYLKRSKSRNIYFNLSLKDFNEEYFKPCFYCGIDKYPGLDRLDSGKGYIKANIVPCCKFCNRAKHQETLDTFLEWLAHVRSSQQ